ncbi:RusA-like resolvase [Gordonia phage Finkle]|uniref:RusA-like resolvase n=1 Tax=Gordonia phage Finkle TaxID=2926099 RepID=A0A9E7SZH4_9CAUD|nr:RusA-like resolvase [Gordonia phage Finkle]UTN92978.1 RusA-like resolvase [Gordonia phage Finkle]
MPDLRIDLPWPSPPLSLNDRQHWRAKANKTAAVRHTMHQIAKAARLPRNVDHLTVQLVYRPRDRRRRDTDNLVATLKPICDALAAGTTKHPGYGVVQDDTPEWMAKPEPLIVPAEKGKGGAMWLLLTIRDRPGPDQTPEHELADRYSREDHQ